MMILCPLAMSNFSDAAEDSDTKMNSATEITANELLKKIEENGNNFTLDTDYYLKDGSTKLVFQNNTVLDGAGHTIYGSIGADCILNDDESPTVKVEIKDLTLNGDRKGTIASLSQGINVQNQRGNNDSSASEDNQIRFLDLSLDGCKITNFTWKGLYLTNTERLVVNNCEFENIATVEEDIKSGDHAIDVVLVEVQGAEIAITNNKFIGHVGANASIQIQQRGSDNTDDQATDMDPQVNATINSVLISGNDFSKVTSTDVDIRLGSWPKTGDERTYSKAFPSTIMASPGVETVVASCTENGTNGVSNPDYNVFVTLSGGSSFSTVGSTTTDADDRITGIVDYFIESGSAVLSGYVPEYMSITVEKDATAVMNNLENHGAVYGYDNNITGTSTGNAIDNTDTVITPPTWDDDDDYIPPIVPSQTEDSGDDDSVTIVACAAATVVAALLAAFLIIDRKH